MKKAYYLYRPHPHFGEFYPGKTLNLLTDNRDFENYLTYPLQILKAKKYFPDGLSPHGLSSLLNPKRSDTNFMDPIVEIIFELVRKLHFPDAPSRLTSLYAADSIPHAEKWFRLLHDNFGDQHGQTAQSLWEIEYETKARLCDASYLDVMLDGGFSYIDALENAHNYWLGRLSAHPVTELLIPYPVTVVRMLTDYDCI